jgi:hypothetical protein
MLGGGWGFANYQNRSLGLDLFYTVKNETVARKYNRIKHEKGKDQLLLLRHVAKYSLKDSTIHDSFNCVLINGKPWPTKRDGNCYFGCRHSFVTIILKLTILKL